MRIIRHLKLLGLLLANAYLLWLSIRVGQSSFTPTWLPKIALLYLANLARERFELYSGIEVQIEWTFIIPNYFDDVFPDRYPQLAIKMGMISECDPRIGGLTESGSCRAARDWACYEHSVRHERGKAMFESMRACSTALGALTPGQARLHAQRCHNQPFAAIAPSFEACVFAKPKMAEARDQCFLAVEAMFICADQYGLLDVVLKAVEDRGATVTTYTTVTTTETVTATVKHSIHV